MSLQNDIIVRGVYASRYFRMPFVEDVTLTPGQPSGSIVYNVDTEEIFYSDGQFWLPLMQPPLVAGVGISIVGDVISTTTSLADASGAGTSLIGSGTSPAFTLKTLVAGSNVNFTGSTSSTITINAVVPTAVTQLVAGTGISVSPGSGVGVVTISNTGVTQLIAGPNITLSAGTGSITISATGGGGGVTQLIAGTNITLSPPGGTGVVTINASGGGGGTLTSSGGAVSLVNNGPSLIMKGLTAGPGITVTDNTTFVTIGRPAVEGFFAYITGDVAINKLDPITPFNSSSFPGWSAGGTMNGTTYVVGTTGYYNIHWHIGMDSDQLVGIFRVNGTAILSGIAASANAEGSAGGGGTMLLTSGDVLDMTIDGAASDPATIRVNAAYTGAAYPHTTYFSAVLIR